MPENKNLPTERQIIAAQELHKKMEYWNQADEILAELKEKDPGLTDRKLTFLKATLVNSFYNAGYREIEEVTRWIVAQKPALPEEYRNIGSNDDARRIDLVRSIALRGRTEKTRQFDPRLAEGYVFASKFAHFFLDADAFPIYDQYARLLVHFHIDDLNEEEQPSSKYGKPYERFFQFYKKFFRLKQQLEQRDSISYSTKDLDCYLWPAGQYITWKKCCFPKRPFYINERVPFDGSDNKSLFERLFPQAMLEDITDELLLSELNWTNTKQQEEWKERKKRRGEKCNGTQT